MNEATREIGCNLWYISQSYIFRAVHSAIA
jgi:hypothetical protein